MLDQKDLKCLIEVIDEGGFEAAARVLHLSTGAVSQRIRRLEDVVGAPLIVRGKPHRLTRTGEQVMSFARRIWLLQNEMDRSFAHAGNSGKTIPIAVNDDSLTCWFLEAIKGFTEEVGLYVDIKTTNSEETHDLFVSGQVLAAVTSNPKPVPGSRLRILGSLPYEAVCSPDFASAHFPEGVDRESLRSAPALYYDRQDSVPSRFLDAFGLTPNEVSRHFLPGAAELYRATAIGMGWSTFPSRYLELQGEKARLIALQPTPIAVELYWKTWDMASREISALTTHVLRTAKRLLRT